jgi:hypothetical protein
MVSPVLTVVCLTGEDTGTKKKKKTEKEAAAKREKATKRGTRTVTAGMAGSSRVLVVVTAMETQTPSVPVLGPRNMVPRLVGIPGITN